MSTLKWFTLYAILGYGALLALLYLTQRAIQYFPERFRTAPAAAGLPQAQEVVLETSDGERVIAWHVPPRGNKPVVLYFHGNGGALVHRVDRFRGLIANGNGLVALSYRGYGGSSGSPSEEGLLADRFRDLTVDGTGLVALSYRGYGGSSGAPTEVGLVSDALAAYAFTTARYPGERIVLWGESLGSGLAVALASQMPVAYVILQSPFTSAADVGIHRYWFVPVRLLMKDQFRSDLRVGKITAPVLILHGDRDDVVPIALAERLYGLINAPKRFVRFAGVGHEDFGAEAVEAAKQFIGKR